MEGTQCFDPPDACDSSNLVLPTYEYDHSVGRSVTGGYVYRGPRLVRLQERQREISRAAHEAMAGQTHSVLVEGPSRYDEGVICGRTSTFKMVNFPGNLQQVGQTVDVSIIAGFTNSLR